MNYRNTVIERLKHDLDRAWTFYAEYSEKGKFYKGLAEYYYKTAIRLANELDTLDPM